LTAGNYYFVSDATPGLLVNTEPTNITSYSNPLLFTLSTTTGIVFPFRPSTVPSSANPGIGPQGNQGNQGTSITSLVMFGATFDGGATTPTAPIIRYIEVPYNCTINSWTITGNATGSASIDVWFIAGSTPPAAPPIPTSANIISASAPIVISSAQSASGGTSAISTWSPILTQWGQLAFNLSSISTFTSINIQIQCTKN
jgi:hypothetical protein